MLLGIYLLRKCCYLKISEWVQIKLPFIHCTVMQIVIKISIIY